LGAAVALRGETAILRACHWRLSSRLILANGALLALLIDMPYQIVSMVLDLVVGVIGGACLLRLYMQQQRIPMSARAGNPIGPFLFAISDWIVLPLRRVLPGLAFLDLASLLAAYALELAQYSLLWLIQGMPYGYGAVAGLAGVGLLRLALSGMTAMVFIYALLSWVQSASPVSDLLDRLVAPLLAPIRRYLPLVGGVDLSPLALLLALQIAGLLIHPLDSAVLMLLA
jgi:YggT family protein